MPYRLALYTCTTKHQGIDFCEERPRIMMKRSRDVFLLFILSSLMIVTNQVVTAPSNGSDNVSDNSTSTLDTYSGEGTSTSSYIVPESNQTNFTLPDNIGSNTTGNASIGNETDYVTESTGKSAPVNPFAIINKGFVSKAQYETSSYVINVVLKPIVCTSGIIMNIMGVCVLLHKDFRRSTYTYLCFLAISDVGYLLCGLIRSIPKIVNLYDVVAANYIDMNVFPYITMYFDFAFTRLSVFLICALSIERFMAVLRPLKVKELFLSRRALSICIGLSVFCMLMYVHNLFIYYPKPYVNPARNITMYAVGRRPWYAASVYKQIFTYANDIFNIYIPPLILITCNIGILTKLYLVRRERAKLFASQGDSKSSQDQRRLTLTLLIISFFFLSVFIPVIVVQFLSRYDEHIKAFGREHYFLFLMADVTSLFWSMSSANDCIVYIYTSKQFRETLVGMICKRRRTVQKRTTVQTVQTVSSVASTN